MTVDLDALSALLEKATPGELIKESFLLIHKVATKQSSRSYMSIPADPTRDADLIVGDALKHYVALRNAAPAMIQELRELRVSRVPPEREELLLAAMDAATARAERDALRAEVEGLKDAYWKGRAVMGFDNDGAERCDVVDVPAMILDDCAEMRVTLDESYAENDALSAQLATAHDDAIEEAVHELGIYRPSAEQNGDPEVLRSIAHTVAYPDAAARVRALKKTTKGGGS